MFPPFSQHILPGRMFSGDPGRLTVQFSLYHDFPESGSTRQ